MRTRLHSLFVGTLRGQLILAVALVHAVMIVAFVWDYTGRQKTLLLERQTEQTQALAQSVATSAAGWVAARDVHGLQEIVVAQQRYPELRYTMILDKQGKVLAHSDSARVGQYLYGLPRQAEMQLLAHTPERVDVICPVFLENVHIGWVRVGLGQSTAVAALGSITRNGIVYAGAAILFGSVIAWLIGNRVTRRLHAIQQVADAVQSGDLEQRIDVKGGDEVAQLAAEFNDMLDSLAASRDGLAASEKRWIRALESTGLGVWDWNAVTNKVYFSHLWKSMLGYADDEIGDDLTEWSDRVHPDDLAGAYTALERHFRGEAPAYRNEFRMRRKDGSWCWILDQGMVFERSEDGRPLRVVGTHTDITDRKLAEDALRASEERASQIIENAPDAMLVADVEGRLQLVNSRASEVFGYAPDELVGETVEILIPEALHGRHRDYRKAYARQPESRPMGKSKSLLARRKDGSLFPVEVSLAPMQVQGQTQVIATVVDITERLALEAELVAHRDRLEERVAQRTVELEQARAQAERLAKVKSEFLANMSHEIRTPLNAVLGFARIGVRDQADARARENYDRILNAGEHLLSVINDILDISKIEAGKLAIEQRPFQLAAVIANATSFVSGAAKSKGLAYAVAADPDLPEWVQGDAHRLQQVLVNLLSNAVKYTERGVVRLAVARQGERLRFDVSDTGIGMSREHLERIFQPFEQADTSTTRRYGGTGLGLAISRDLVTLMGGEIGVDSSPGVGSCFTVTLPLPATTSAARAAGRPEMSGRRLEGVRVLAAEDVPVNRIILEDLLAHEGARVIFAENGQQAVERLIAAGRGAFDVVLMDVQMPVMDGYEATRRIRALAPDLPVIGLTAHALEEERARCHAAGMVEHVVKPVDTDVLVAAIRKHMRDASTVNDHADTAPVPDNAQTAFGRMQAESTVDTASAGLIDWAGLLARCNGRQTTVDKLIQTILESYADAAAKLRDAAHANRFDELGFLAHSLKGMGANIEAHELSKLAGCAEDAARAGLTDAAALADALADMLDRLMRELAGGIFG